MIKVIYTEDNPEVTLHDYELKRFVEAALKLERDVEYRTGQSLLIKTFLFAMKHYKTAKGKVEFYQELIPYEGDSWLEIIPYDEDYDFIKHTLMFQHCDNIQFGFAGFVSNFTEGV